MMHSQAPNKPKFCTFLTKNQVIEEDPCATKDHTHDKLKALFHQKMYLNVINEHQEI